MGCGASKSKVPPAETGAAPDKAPPPTTTAPKPERVQDLPPGWLPSIDEEYKLSKQQQQGNKEMRDAFAGLFGDDDDDDDSMDDTAIKKEFKKYDSDNSGSIERGELRSLLSDSLRLSYEQVDEYATLLLKKYDGKDGKEDGKIEWKAFRKFYRKMLASEKARKALAVSALTKASTSASTKQRALELFASADKDGSGTLTADELSALLRESLGSLAVHLSNASKWDAFVNDALSRGDKDKNATWDAAEFANFFGKCLAHPLLVEAYTDKVTLRLQAD